MLMVSVTSPDGFTAREGDPITLNFAMTGTQGSVVFDFRVIDETTDSSDHVGSLESTSFVLFSPFVITQSIVVDFGTLKDRIDEETETVKIEVTLDGGVFEGGGSVQTLTLSILDDVLQHGTKSADQFVGSAADDLYKGYGGRDVIKGMGGDDVLKGGGGGDRVIGGGGDDRLLGNGKNDKLVGGAGSDFLAGGKGADKMNGGGGRDVMKGQGGNDVFKFSKGKDVVRDFDKRGNDVIDLRKVKSIDDFDDLVDNHLSFSSGNAIISDLSGNTLKLNNTTLASLTEDDFLF